MILVTITNLAPDVSIDIMNLIEFCRANSDELEAPIPLIRSLDFNGCINFPLNSDPKLLIALINQLLQPRILLLKFPMF